MLAIDIALVAYQATFLVVSIVAKGDTYLGLAVAERIIAAVQAGPLAVKVLLQQQLIRLLDKP